MLKVSGVSKKYYNKKTKKSNEILNNISFEVNNGNIIGLIGKNGVGKSTLLSILSTLIIDYEGNIKLDKINIKSNLNEYRENIGYVPQKAVLFEELTVKENLDFFYNEKVPLFSKERVVFALELNLYMDKKIKILSEGLKNRVNIAIGIINNPDILIMDEPLVGVSLGIKRKVYNLFKQLSSEGKSIIMSTHELDSLENICTHLLIIREDGTICFDSMEDFHRDLKARNINLLEYLHILGGI